ncbi:MAG TPA: SRPBCC family protein [Lacipirellulaceae bacterium]|nr:SRPBCC family protein [Lacipirellulaceae bacterium]
MSSANLNRPLEPPFPAMGGGLAHGPQRSHAVQLAKLPEAHAALSGSRVNVGDSERLASLLAGTTLAAYGLFRAERGRLPLLALGASLVYRGLSGHCSAYSRLGVNTAQGHGHGAPATVIPAKHGAKVEHSVTIARPAAELYGFWRDVENLPKVMKHLQRVDATDRTHSHWVADGLLGATVEWDAEIFNDRENEAIAWRSLPGSAVDTAGSVHFKEMAGSGGTQVTVSLKYDPPAGKVGHWIATLMGEGLEQKLADDLQGFKQIMEGGDGENLHGRPQGS